MITGTFTAAGQVSETMDVNDGFTAVLTGTFTGRVAVEVSVDGAGARYGVAGTLHEAGVFLGDLIGLAKVRLRCTGLDHGQITYDLTGV